MLRPNQWFLRSLCPGVHVLSVVLSCSCGTNSGSTGGAWDQCRGSLPPCSLDQIKKCPFLSMLGAVMAESKLSNSWEKGCTASTNSFPLPCSISLSLVAGTAGVESHRYCGTRSKLLVCTWTLTRWEAWRRSLGTKGCHFRQTGGMVRRDWWGCAFTHTAASSPSKPRNQNSAKLLCTNPKHPYGHSFSKRKENDIICITMMHSL